MTPAELSALARSIYGPDWRVPLATALGVTDRTIRKWLARERLPNLAAQAVRGLAMREACPEACPEAGSAAFARVVREADAI